MIEDYSKGVYLQSRFRQKILKIVRLNINLVLKVSPIKSIGFVLSPIRIKVLLSWLFEVHFPFSRTITCNVCTVLQLKLPHFRCFRGPGINAAAEIATTRVVLQRAVRTNNHGVGSYDPPIFLYCAEIERRRGGTYTARFLRKKTSSYQRP